MGRPDLEATPEQAKEKARALHRSLVRLLGLPPETVVLPGHTSEPVPFVGRPISATLGEVEAALALLQDDEEAFVEKVAGRVSPHVPRRRQRGRRGGEDDPRVQRATVFAAALRRPAIYPSDHYPMLATLAPAG